MAKNNHYEKKFELRNQLCCVLCCLFCLGSTRLVNEWVSSFVDALSGDLLINHQWKKRAQPADSKLWVTILWHGCSLSLSRRKNMYLIMPASLTRNGWVIRFNDIRFSLSRIFRMDGLGMFIWNYDGIHTTTRWWKSDTMWLLENDNFSISSLAHDPRVPFSPINLRRIIVSAFRWGGTFIANIIISGQNEWTWRASFELNSISHYNQTMY